MLENEQIQQYGQEIITNLEAMLRGEEVPEADRYPTDYERELLWSGLNEANAQEVAPLQATFPELAEARGREWCEQGNNRNVIRAGLGVAVVAAVLAVAPKLQLRRQSQANSL